MSAAFVGIACAVAAIELWVRVAWDYRRGTPGLFLSDAWRGQRLAAGYDGWFAGVPVRINNLGFRDRRDYDVGKPPGTFRVLIIGDSVTFGHGATFATTYPFLLEQRLIDWRPDVRWQVWNLGVPGYNTRQELTYLQEIAPRFAPDLVVIGFYPNDFTANEFREPGRLRRVATPLVRTLQRYFYSFEFYKRAYLTAQWKLSGDRAFRQQLEHMPTEAGLLGRQLLVDAPEQGLTAVDYLDDGDVDRFVCAGMPHADPRRPAELAAHIETGAPQVAPWLKAVRELQQLAREGAYRIVFFINMAPETCPHDDRFYRGFSLADDDVLLQVLGQSTPAVSSARAFLHYRPSQMPLAAGHSMGNANAVKAKVLFEFLRDRVLPGLMTEGVLSRQP